MTHSGNVSKYSRDYFNVWSITHMFNVAANPNRWFEIEKSTRRKRYGKSDWEPPPWEIII